VNSSARTCRQPRALLEHQLHALGSREQGTDEAGDGIAVVDRVPAAPHPLLELRMGVEQHRTQPLRGGRHRVGVLAQQLVGSGVPGHARSLAPGTDSRKRLPVPGRVLLQPA
jgi:hypothetical protein